MSTHPEPQFGTWSPPKLSPPSHEPVIVAGVLHEETSPATHEGYWDGKRWNSIRGNHVPITAVIAWMPMPTVPANPPFAS